MPVSQDLRVATINRRHPTTYFDCVVEFQQLTIKELMSAYGIPGNLVLPPEKQLWWHLQIQYTTLRITG